MYIIDPSRHLLISSIHIHTVTPTHSAIQHFISIQIFLIACFPQNFAGNAQINKVFPVRYGLAFRIQCVFHCIIPGYHAHTLVNISGRGHSESLREGKWGSLQTVINRNVTRSVLSWKRIERLNFFLYVALNFFHEYDDLSHPVYFQLNTDP